MPESPIELCELGNSLRAQGRLDEARAAHEKAVALRPDFAEGWNNLGAELKDQGLLDDAIAAFRRAIAADPMSASTSAALHSNLLYTLYFHPDFSADGILQEHLAWAAKHAEPLTRQADPPSPAHDRDPGRPLRIAYISPDFCYHVIGRFMLPILANHDRRQVHVTCLADEFAPDEMTAQIRMLADEWHCISGMSDDEVARLVRELRIDILVDLTLHMAHNRMLVFARKPAPVQATYLAYAGTSGMKAMDYRLTDAFLDPADDADGEKAYVETSVRLPSYWNYVPPGNAPAMGALPALRAGHLTFGCLNNFCKVTPPTLRTWAALLRHVPDSWLILHAHAGSHRDRVRALFAENQVAPERIEFVGKLTIIDYFLLYQRIDIGLDPFPYAGGTTTCDAMWMGVPAITLAGRTAVGRGGVSLLSQVGLIELIAGDEEEYVNKAAVLAGDLSKLAMMRASMRERMRRSPLLDARAHTRHLERAYREMWTRWCAKF